ncbi:MAG: hypothetical protein HC834_00380 [Rhodospirillales bacterium]|nr:hypothetical protein [Rhodospirillales bacterium]
MIDSHIEISSRRYERVFGAKPEGFRLWYFQLPGGRLFAYTGDYGHACRAARLRAKQLPAGVLPRIQVSA